MKRICSRTTPLSLCMFLWTATCFYCFWGLPGVCILCWALWSFHLFLTSKHIRLTSCRSVLICSAVLKVFFPNIFWSSTTLVPFSLSGLLPLSTFPVHTCFLESTSDCWFSSLLLHLHGHLFYFTYWQTTPPQSTGQLSAQSSSEPHVSSFVHKLTNSWSPFNIDVNLLKLKMGLNDFKAEKCVTVHILHNNIVSHLWKYVLKLTWQKDSHYIFFHIVTLISL